MSFNGWFHEFWVSYLQVQQLKNNCKRKNQAPAGKDPEFEVHTSCLSSANRKRIEKKKIADDWKLEEKGENGKWKERIRALDRTINSP